MTATVDVAPGAPVNRDHPVLLVPGAFGQDLVYWNVIRYLLQRDGFNVFTLTFPWFTLSDLRASARLLHDRVEELAAREGADRVSLVCHSMGGLIARYYVRYLDGERRVARLVHLGVPHRGTLSGVVLPLLRGTRQIIPGSPFLNALNGPGEPSIPSTNIFSRTDFIVFPPHSAKLKRASHVRNHSAPFAGHWGLLASPRVYRWIRDGLAAPPFDPRAAPPLEPEPMTESAGGAPRRVSATP